MSSTDGDGLGNGNGTQLDTQYGDEDGLVSVQMSPQGTGRVATVTVAATNSTAGTAYLYAWLDTNRNGKFDESERRTATLTPTGVQQKSLDWSLWSDNVAATTYLRLRVCSVEAECSRPWLGASNGEVEDYPLTFDFSPTRAVIGDVSIDALTPHAAIATLLGDADPNDASALLALLTALDPDAAAGLDGADAATVRAALTALLDADGDGLIALLRWETLEENGTIGFYVERISPGGDWIRINADLLPGLITSPGGGDYALLDPDALAGQTLQYRLIEQEAGGEQITYGPYQVQMVAAAPAIAASLAGAKVNSLSRDQARPAPAGEAAPRWQGLGNGLIARPRKPDFARAGDEEKAAGAYALAANAVGQTVAATQWLYTSDAGLYRLSAADLSALTGRPINRVRNALRSGRLVSLTSGGQGAPWVYDAPSDALLFSALDYRTLFTQENAFRLSVANGPVRTMPRVVGSGPRAGNPGGTAIERVRLEKDTFYNTYIVRGDVEADYWFQDYLYPNQAGRGELVLQLDLPGVHPAAGGATVAVRLYGGTDVLEGDDHQVTLRFDGVQLGAVEWDGFAPSVVTVNLSSDQLAKAAAGTPLVLESARLNSIQWLDYVDVTYPRLLRAVDNRLLLRQLPAGIFTVSGFDTADIRVVVAPGTPGATRRDNVAIKQGVDGWQATFRIRKQADVVLATADALAAPVRIAADEPGLLRTWRKRVDYLIVAPRELAQTAEGLRAWRAWDFVNVEIAWLSDVEQEFGDGRPGADALDAFLEYTARFWRRAPTVVTLLGRGTVDHRDLMGYANSLIPVPMVDTPWGLVASDYRYAEVGGKVRFALGRIPVVDDTEGLAYLAKLQAGGGAMEAGFKAVVVADAPDEAGDFHANADELATLLGGYGYETKGLYHCASGQTNPACTNVRTALTNGSTWETALVNYSGHGSMSDVGKSQRFLRSSDVPGLVNTAQPLFSAMTCSVGANYHPQRRSLTEALVLHAGGGAAAALSPSGLSNDVDAHRLNLLFIDALRQGASIGESTRDAQNQARGSISPFMEQIYQVTGDPAVRLP